MINDSRYQVEDWIADNIDQQSTLLAVGPLQYLPRFERTHNNMKWLRNRVSSFSKFQSVRDYDFLLSDLSLYDFEKHRFDYLIVSGLSKKDYTKLFFIIEELEDKTNIEYKLVYKFQSIPWFNFFPSEGVLSINPTIEIYALGSVL